MTTQRLTRAQWGAASVPSGRPTSVASTRGSGIHWVGPGIYGTGRLWDHSLCAGKVRGIQRAHMAGEWYDIAYNEVVCPHGTRYEGRGYHVQTGANGSTFGNAHWYAILALVGVGDPITTRLLEGLADAAQAYRDRAGAGAEVTWHRALLEKYADRSTSCPGEPLISKARAGTFSRPWPTPQPSTTPTTTWKDPSMKPVLVRVKGTAAVYLSADRVTRRWVVDPADLATVKADMAAVGASTTVRDVDASKLNHYGLLVGPAPTVAK